MKIKRYNLDRMTIEAFAMKYNLTMEIRERNTKDSGSRFYAEFEGAEVMRHGFLVGEFGNGRTEGEAINNYAKSISGKRLAIRAYTSQRREIKVPILLNSQG
jgi:hypothetical protein